MRNYVCQYPPESHSKAQQSDIEGHCSKRSPHAVLASRLEPDHLEAWLEQVRSNCEGDLQDEDDFVDNPIDGIDSCQPRHLTPSTYPKTSVEVKSGPSSGLFVPDSPCFVAPRDSLGKRRPSDPKLVQERGTCQSGRSTHGFDSTPVPGYNVLHETPLEFQRQPRRKTREDRYDTKVEAGEDQDRPDKLKRQRHSHRSRKKHKLRSGREIMKNFRSDTVNKEHVIVSWFQDIQIHFLTVHR